MDTPAIYKPFKDCCPGKPVKLEAKEIGIYTDEKSRQYYVWKPVNTSWNGLYRLEPVNGGRGKYLVVGLSTWGMYAYQWEEKYIIKSE